MIIKQSDLHSVLHIDDAEKMVSTIFIKAISEQIHATFMLTDPSGNVVMEEKRLREGVQNSECSH